MTWETLLTRLAALVGIESSYTEVYGRRIDTPLDAKVPVLAALGFDVSSVSSLTNAVVAVEEEPWRRWIAPWVVRTADAAGLDLDLFLPADDAEQQWSWEITFEDGATDYGTFRRHDLLMLSARDIDGRRIEHRRLSVQRSGPIGYHRMRVCGPSEVEASLVLAPHRCYVPPQFEGPDWRAWGLSAHIYTLRSQANWGVGDFASLGRLCQIAGEAGASIVATNPFHALFPRRSSDASPYSPSSRLFLNSIYIDVAAVPGFSGSAAGLPSEATLSVLRETKLVDYRNVMATKLRALESLFEGFYARLDGDGEGDKEVHAFRRFSAEAGPALQRFAAFSLLDELQSGEGGELIPWTLWPSTYRTPDGPAVDRLVGEHSKRFTFHQYVQFLADQQLGQAADDARRASMNIGIMRDLALGVSPDGADAWMHQQTFANGLRCGAPPDHFHPHGQEWGVVPFNPLALRRDHSPFIATVRANMRHAGGLRIDHVAGLQRQFVVPLGEQPDHGCYLNFPREELFAILALESQRRPCLVLGEDLGTLPDGFREHMRVRAMLNSAVLYFEQLGDARFRSPRDYPAQSVATVGTHDLPTLVGYWEGRDIAVRQRLGIFSNAEADQARERRLDDCRRLSEALAGAGFPPAAPAGGTLHASSDLIEAVHRFLASSSARLFLAQPDDLIGEVDQINVPGTVDTYPNWRRKLSVALEAPAFVEVIARLAQICREQARGQWRAPLR
jgi:4-alpha-glucanotransferase